MLGLGDGLVGRVRRDDDKIGQPLHHLGDELRTNVAAIVDVADYTDEDLGVWRELWLSAERVDRRAWLLVVAA